MPELPEVETIMRGLKNQLIGKKMEKIVVRQAKIRWTISENIHDCEQQTILGIERRGKYILMQMPNLWLIAHLGMSGSLKIVLKDILIKKHDHVDFEFDEFVLRYNDPRRFGAILCCEEPLKHVLLKNLGIEPFSREFSPEYLLQKMQKSTAPIKSFLMNSKNIVGIGNIYAAECLFLAKVFPLRKSNSLTIDECKKLYAAIQQVLAKAINEGGTTLKDFVNSEGKPGYFAQSLQTYGRANKPCFTCQTPLEQLRIGQRSTVFCKVCQV